MVDEVKEPKKEWIEEQKKKYGKVYRCKISGRIYIYRPLLRDEFKEIQKNLTPEMTPQGPVVSATQQNEVEESVSKLCIIWPENYKEMKVEAGVPSALSAYISDSSGFIVEEPPVEL